VGCSYHIITPLHVQIVRVDCIMVVHPINACLHAHQQGVSRDSCMALNGFISLHNLVNLIIT
jgi:hypothetical protein